jgi:hypothetical protein
MVIYADVTVPFDWRRKEKELNKYDKGGVFVAVLTFLVIHTWSGRGDRDDIMTSLPCTPAQCIITITSSWGNTQLQST